MGLMKYRRMQQKEADQLMKRSLRVKYWVKMRKEYIERKKESLLLMTVRLI